MLKSTVSSHISRAIRPHDGLTCAMTTWNPADYARHSAAQWQWAEELKSRLALSGSEALLDLGCGDGRITAALADALPRGGVVGIDNSEEMIRYAQAKHPPAKHANLRFRRLDVRALDYREEFEVVFSNAALHWVGDHRAILAGAFRALRAGGRLAFSFGGRGNAAAALEVIRAVGGQPQWRDCFQGFVNPYYFYGPEQYAAWVSEAGFVARRIALAPKDMTHSGVEGLASWKVPEAKREGFISDLVETYARAHPPDAEGNIHVGMARLEVEARKP
jgi:trans-aconitate methyltransferase